MPHVIFSNAMDAVHDHSLPAIAMIQQSFFEQKNFMVWISTFFDPRHVFLIYAPILFAFSRHVSQKLIITLTIAEWSNQILKWFLAGERPYWYVHERTNSIFISNSDYLNEQLITSNNLQTNNNNDTLIIPKLELHQFPVTCELGAGSPSGHAMVTASVWYILIDSLLKGQLMPNNTNLSIHTSATTIKDNFNKNLTSKLGWTFYFIILALVSVSRVFLACHFPHQCIGGALMGLAIAKFVSDSDLSKIRVLHYQFGTIFMFAAVMATYGILKSIGFNPLWSVDKAMKWCVKPEYIHLDTTPFFSMMRYLGFCFGSGLGLFSSFVNKHHELESPLVKNNNIKRSTVQYSVILSRIISSIISIYWGKLLLSIPIDKSNMELFYVISFFQYVAFTYGAIAPIPYYTQYAINRFIKKTKSH